LAYSLQKYLQHHFERSPEVIPCSRDHEQNTFVVPDFVHKFLKNSQILIVDDGVNTGSTLLGLHYAVHQFKPKGVKYLAFIDRLFGTDRQTIRNVLGANYYFLFHLAVPVYREWDCPVCTLRESNSYYRGSHTEKAEIAITRGNSNSPSAARITMETE
jgi:hypothetical protein